MLLSHSPNERREVQFASGLSVHQVGEGVGERVGKGDGEEVGALLEHGGKSHIMVNKISPGGAPKQELSRTSAPVCDTHDHLRV